MKPQDRSNSKKALKRYKYWSCCLLVTTVILIVTAIFTP